MVRVEKLSAREKQIARFVLKGKTYAQIANKLSLSPGTVVKYAMRLREKTGFPNSTAEAAEFAKKNGML